MGILNKEMMSPKTSAMTNTRDINLGIPMFNHLSGRNKIRKICVTNRNSKASAKRKTLSELVPTEKIMLATICTTAYKSQPPICNVQYSLSLFTTGINGLKDYQDSVYDKYLN